MKEIKNMLLRAKNIPILEIEIVNPENDKILCKEFNEEMLKPFIKTGENLNRNKIILPIWDDEIRLKGIIPPWGYHKFCDFTKKEFGLGLVHIQFRYGKKIRKLNDFRFRAEKEVQIKDFYFLFDFSLRHYVQVNPDHNEEWKKRISTMELLEQQTLPFIWDYLIKTRPNFIDSHEKFKKNNSKTYSDINIQLNHVEEFLDNSWLYLDLLFIVYGDITQDEHFILEQSIRRQKQLISKTRNYIEQFKKSQKFDVHPDYQNRQDKNSPFGIVTETFFILDNLLKGRKEKIDNNEWFAYTIMQGYIKVNKVNNTLYPNFTEVERRRSLYKQAANHESENIIHNEIIQRLK